MRQAHRSGTEIEYAFDDMESRCRAGPVTTSNTSPGAWTGRSGSPHASVRESSGNPAFRAPLSVATDLISTVNVVDATVESTGERVFVSFDSLPEGVRTLRGQPQDTTGPFSTLLETTDLAVAGVGTRPGVLSEQPGVAPLEARLGGAVSVVGAEISTGVRAVSRFLR